MKTVTQVIFNDRNHPMRIQIQSYDGDGYLVISKNSMKKVSIEIPDGHIVYFKIWENNQALLSHVEET